MARSTSDITWTPEDGTTYTAGTDEVAEGVIILYVGAELTFTDTSTDFATTYHFAIYAFDDAKNY